MKKRTLAFSFLSAFLFISVNVSLAQGQHTSLVSINKDSNNSGNKESYFQAISANGRYVAFTSEATDLVNVPDNNNLPDVFVRDLKTGITSLVSVNLSGTAAGNGGSSSPAISADGRYISFDSDSGDLVSQVTTRFISNVYVRDTVLGITTLVSIDKTGTKGGNHNSLSSAISANGKVVTYASVASDLVPNDTNGRLDIFARDLQSGITHLVTINSSGTGGGNNDSSSPPGGGVEAPRISADGRIIVFPSLASNLVNVGDMNDKVDIFARDLQAGITYLVSVDATGTSTGDDASGQFSISADGHRIAFSSAARNLVSGANGGLFLRNLDTQTTTLISVDSDGNPRFGLQPSVSADGRFIAFISNQLTQISDTNLALDVYVRDVQNGVNTLVSVNQQGNATGNGESLAPRISADGRFVTFMSRAKDLAGIEGLPQQPCLFCLNVFVRDLKTSQTLLASKSYDGSGAGNFSSSLPFISDDGKVTIFSSGATNLALNDTNMAEDVFAFELPSTFFFDLCIQDDSNGNILQINTTTGEYLFMNCSGFTSSGVGTIIRKGSITILQHNAADRRVTAKIDSSTNKATATVQMLSQGTTFSIADRNISNNTCACH